MELPLPRFKRGGRRLPVIIRLFAIALILAGSRLEAQRAVVHQPGPSVSLDARLQRTDSLIVKFDERIPVRLRAGRPTAVDGTRLRCRLLLEGLRVERFFDRDEADLEQERAALLTSSRRRRRVAGIVPDATTPPDLNNYYRVHTSGAEESLALMARLETLPEVQVAYLEPSPAAIVPLDGPDVPPRTPLFAGGQGYLGPSPLGVGHSAVLDLVGATAPDLTVFQIEFAWDFDHEDACRLVLENVVGAPPDPYDPYSAEHGNAVAGILTADRNGFGVDGMASDAEFHVVSLGPLGNSPARAISLVSADARPGDVLVTSLGYFIPAGALAPLDFYPAEFDAIRTLTMRGVTHCTGAGNRAPPFPVRNLGETSVFGTRYVPGAPDSGAVIVGGGRSDAVEPWPDSNFGLRVDCNAWAEHVTTIGFGGELFSVAEPTQDYTARFYGTSSATPIVGGVAAALTNIVLEQNGVLLTPGEIRDALRLHGSPQTSGHPIGPRPDLVRLLAAFGLPDGLRLRLAGTGGPGGARGTTSPFVLELRGPPGSHCLVLGSPSRGHRSLGWNRDLLVDPARAGRTLVHLDEGHASVPVRLPASLGATLGPLYFQAMVLPGPGATSRRPHLTNSVVLRPEWWLR